MRAYSNLHIRIGVLLFPVFIFLQSCLNPFAPILGEFGGRSWTDQTTVGELLQNFALSYDYRDSLHYADCLSESFVFNYFDIENGRSDRWFRDTDLKATGAIFRNYEQIALEWSQVPVQVESFSQSDTTILFRVRFNLLLDEEVPIFGYAQFTTRREGEGKFQILNWQDDF